MDLFEDTIAGAPHRSRINKYTCASPSTRVTFDRVQAEYRVGVAATVPKGDAQSVGEGRDRRYR